MLAISRVLMSTGHPHAASDFHGPSPAAASTSASSTARAGIQVWEWRSCTLRKSMTWRSQHHFLQHPIVSTSHPTSCQRATKNFLFFSIHHHNDHMAYLVYLHKVQNRQNESTAIDMWIVVGWGWGWTGKEYRGFSQALARLQWLECQLRGCVCICQNSQTGHLRAVGFSA